MTRTMTKVKQMYSTYKETWTHCLDLLKQSIDFENMYHIDLNCSSSLWSVYAADRYQDLVHN